MAWHQLSVVTDESTATKLSDFFSEIGAVSVTYSDANDEPVYEPAIDQTIIWSQTRVTALFELDADPDLIHLLVFNQFIGHALNDWTAEVLSDQAWERVWLEYFHAMKFADRLWVCPTGQEQYEEGSVCMTLDPGLAFGTGTHPTTALCLEWLALQNLQDKVLIDFGCGSGILGVAALLLGARYVHAIDIDPQALTASRYNAEKNQVQDRINYYLPKQFPHMEADIVIANILAKPLIELSAQIISFVRPGGSLVLSGVLKEQGESVAEVYSLNGLSLFETVSREDWLRLAGKKP